MFRGVVAPDHFHFLSEIEIQKGTPTLTSNIPSNGVYSSDLFLAVFLILLVSLSCQVTCRVQRSYWKISCRLNTVSSTVLPGAWYNLERLLTSNGQGSWSYLTIHRSETKPSLPLSEWICSQFLLGEIQNVSHHHEACRSSWESLDRKLG